MYKVKVSPWRSRCRWKHLGGAMIASCDGKWITGYCYEYEDATNFHREFFHIVKRFKFCPLCGRPIELPAWMNKKED